MVLYGFVWITMGLYGFVKFCMDSWISWSSSLSRVLL